MSTKLKAKLSSLEEEIDGLRDEHAAAQRDVQSARDTFAANDQLDTDSDEFAAAEKAVGKAGALADRIADAQAKQVAILGLLGDTSAVPGRERRAAGDRTDPRATGVWDSGELFAGEVAAQLERASASSGRFGRIEAGTVASREALAAEIGTTTVGGLIRPDYRGLQVAPQRPLDILDLVSTGTTDSNSIEYTQSSGINSGALEVAEGALKPELDLTFTDADAPVRTIAGWLKLRKQTLSDAPALRSFVDGQLRYAVRRRLNDQVANGNGTGQNLRGILQTTGRQVPTVTATQNLLDRLLRGITVILLTDQAANGVAVNPLQWEQILTLRDRSGGEDDTGGYLGGGPFGTTARTVWGLPLVGTAAIPAAKGLVGDFTKSQVLIREAVQVLFSDSDQDDFIRNRVTMLGETRAAHLVWRPDAFAEINLGEVA